VRIPVEASEELISLLESANLVSRVTFPFEIEYEDFTEQHQHLMEAGQHPTLNLRDRSARAQYRAICFELERRRKAASEVPGNPVPVETPVQPSFNIPAPVVNIEAPVVHVDLNIVVRYMQGLCAALLIIIFLLCAQLAHCQIDTIGFKANDNSSVGSVAAPFVLKAGSNCSWAKSGSVFTINCTGGAAAAGGLNGQFQWNNAGSLDGITTVTSDGTVVTAKVGTNWFFVDPAAPTKRAKFDASRITAGQTRTIFIPDGDAVLCPNGTSDGQICTWDNTNSKWVPGDPLVQGLYAAGTTVIPNPVVIGGHDYSGTPTLRLTKVDSAGNLYAVITFASAQAVTGPLTDTQLRATPVPVSGSGNFAVNIAQYLGATVGAANAIHVQPGTGASWAVTNAALTALQFDGSNFLKVILQNSTLAATQSGTWTVQPGNTANTTPWLFKIDQTTPGTTNGVQDAATSATTAAVPAKAIQIGETDGTNLLTPYLDPCSRGARTPAVVNFSSATTTRIVAPAASKKTYICSVILVAAAADNVVFEEGTGGTCGTGTASLAGDTTTGFALAANGGFTLGNGANWVMATAGTNVDLCIKTSAAVQLSGHISYVQY
jgi:hypothetical protein